MQEIFKSKRLRCPRTDLALTPMAVASCYGFPTGIDISKRTVAILELGGAFQLSDVVSYCKRYNLKLPNITTVSVDNALEQSDPTGADGEVCLDIDIIAAAAPGLNITVVFAPNTNQGFIDGVAKCLSLDPDAISISWGGPEDQWETPAMQALDALLQQAEEKGINIFVAAGDNGSTDGEGLGDHCDYPASSPYVIACGGTSLQLNPDGTRLDETAWSTGFLGTGNGTGGGISAVYTTTPAWQTGILPQERAGRREPDISGNADPATGYLVDIDGTLTQIGGTSAVAPLYAALQIIMNEIKGAHIGNMHTKLYANSECFYDITQGSNGGYKAGVGYDCCTGLGVLQPQKFLTVA